MLWESDGPEHDAGHETKDELRLARTGTHADLFAR